MQATEQLFQRIFDQLTEPRIVVLPDEPNFTIVAVNKAYQSATGNYEQVNGQSIWQLFKADTASTNGRTVFENGLNDAIRHQADIKLPIFRFDIAGTSTEKAQPRWWQVEISPVKGDSDELLYLVCTTRNVTLHVQDQAAILRSEHENAALLVRQQEQYEESERSLQRNRELTESEYRLNRIVESTPIGLSIIKGRNLVIETVNDPLLKLWGRKRELVIGRELPSVLPELRDQPFIKLLNRVFDTAKGVRLNRQPVMVQMLAGELHRIFVDFSYDPLFDIDGDVEAVLLTVNDITAIVETQELLQNREEELEVINEELTATNEELAATNEELRSSNEELIAINEELHKLKHS